MILFRGKSKMINIVAKMHFSHHPFLYLFLLWLLLFLMFAPFSPLLLKWKQFSSRWQQREWVRWITATATNFHFPKEEKLAPRSDGNAKMSLVPTLWKCEKNPVEFICCWNQKIISSKLQGQGMKNSNVLIGSRPKPEFWPKIWASFLGEVLNAARIRQRIFFSARAALAFSNESGRFFWAIWKEKASAAAAPKRAVEAAAAAARKAAQSGSIFWPVPTIELSSPKGRIVKND